MSGRLASWIGPGHRILELHCCSSTVQRGLRVAVCTLWSTTREIAASWCMVVDTVRRSHTARDNDEEDTTMSRLTKSRLTRHPVPDHRTAPHHVPLHTRARVTSCVMHKIETAHYSHGTAAPGVPVPIRSPVVKGSTQAASGFDRFKNAKARDQTRNPWLRAVEAGVSSAPLGLSSEMLVRLDERGW